jgi:hypothetical protein
MRQINNPWQQDELRKIAEMDDLHISPLREDGRTYGTPTWIWSVAVDDALYVRAYNGRNSRWYNAAVRQKTGRINAAGLSKKVSFESVGGAINHRIDDAYRKKYSKSPYLDSMLRANAVAATIRISPVVTEPPLHFPRMRHASHSPKRRSLGGTIQPQGDQI